MTASSGEGDGVQPAAVRRRLGAPEGRGSTASGCQNLPARGEPGLGHKHAGRRLNVRVECEVCLAGWGHALGGCGAQVGAPGPS